VTADQFSTNGIGNNNAGSSGTVTQSASGNQKVNDKELVNIQSGLAFIFNGGQNTVSNTNTASKGTVSQSANGNQRLDGSQSINIQSGSEAFASQFGTNNIANINFGAGSITQKIQKNQLGSQDQTITNASITFALQTGISDATNAHTANTSHHGKSGSSSQTLVGS
jgi:hypothetical protein